MTRDLIIYYKEVHDIWDVYYGSGETFPAEVPKPNICGPMSFDITVSQSTTEVVIFLAF